MRTMVTLVFALCLAIPALAQDSDITDVDGQANLEQVKRAKFRNTYVNTEIDFSKYNKLYLGGAYFDYRDVGEPQRTRSTFSTSSSRSVFGIAESERKKFEELVDEAFMNELGKAKNFSITDQLDENTIIMRGAVVDIISRVPPEFVGRSEVYLSYVGEATLVMEFLDGKTGEVLARIAERRAMGRGQIDMMTMPANSVTAWADIRRWANSAAKRLRSELDYAMGE